jgi:pimeloyl-ACP methyl ester carboxylesterase
MTPTRFHSFDGTPIGFTDEGRRTGEPVLMVNGLGGRAPAFGPLMDHLAEYRAVCWDYRGLFDSGRPVRGYRSLSVPDHARDGVALLDHLGIERAHVLGWSMGVQVGLELALHAPERVRSLSLMGGAAGNPYRTLGGSRVARRLGMERLVPQLLKRLQHADGLVSRVVGVAADAEAFIPLMVRLGLVHHDLDRPVFDRLAKGFKALDMHLYLEMLHKLSEHDATERLGELRHPALVIVGSEDVLTPLDAAQQLADGLRHGQLAVVAGGTHYAAVEMPEVLARHLRRHWQAADSRAPMPVEATLAS